MEEKTPAEYWNIVKELKEKKADNTVSNPQDFEQFFKKLFSIQAPEIANPKHTKIEEDVAKILSDSRLEVEEDYTFEELSAAIDKLKNKKSTVLVPAEMLKYSPKCLLTYDIAEGL